MIAVISDIHANLEALQAVLAEIDKRKIERILCLGDVVGYGPDPEACVDIVMERCELYLCGNHEYAMLNEAFGYNRMARESIAFARARLEPTKISLPKKRRRWHDIQQLPVDYQEGHVYFCHASPRDPINEYILAQDCYGAQDKLREIFSMIDGLCMVGHTHTPGVLTERFRFLTPNSFDGVYEAQEHEKAVINVGSVGQPRDNDSRACWVLFDGAGRIEYVRTAYDVQCTIAKIQGTEELSAVNALRLEKGV